MTLFEIFNSLEAIETKDANIDTLYGYPNPETKTITYRDDIKHPTEELWAGVVDDGLVERCSGMTPEERANYYDPSDLKTYQYLEDNGWFPPVDA